MPKKSNLIKNFLFKFQHDKVFLLGSSQAFYYLLSLFPMLVIGLAIIPYLNIDPEQAVNFLKDTLPGDMAEDRKSTRLNSSHVAISYAVFCLKKKKHKNRRNQTTVLS